MKKTIKNTFKRVKEKINKIIDIATLNSEIIYLRKELEESKKKERPYIDKINLLKNDVRILKILNNKLEKKNQSLQEIVDKFEKMQSNIFKE